MIFLNEFDEVVVRSPFKACGGSIRGLWLLNNRKVFLFSATHSKSVEKILLGVFDDLSLLKFRSEFEIIHQTSSVAGSVVRTYQSSDLLLKGLAEDVEKYYLTTPIVIIQDSKYKEITE